VDSYVHPPTPVPDVAPASTPSYNKEAKFIALSLWPRAHAQLSHPLHRRGSTKRWPPRGSGVTTISAHRHAIACYVPPTAISTDPREATPSTSPSDGRTVSSD
jgi:hypothetical protein